MQNRREGYLRFPGWSNEKVAAAALALCAGLATGGCGTGGGTPSSGPRVEPDSIAAKADPSSPGAKKDARGAAEPAKVGSGRHEGPPAGSGPVERSRYTMGTTATVTIEAAGSPAETWAGIAEAALDQIDQVDREASLYKPASDLCRLNRGAFPGPYAPGPIVRDLLDASDRFFRLTDGAYDPSVKPVMDQLGFYREIGSHADPAGLPGALARVGWRRVLRDETRGTVRFERAGMALDFGGIAKGYALDRAVATLRTHAVTRAQLELGRSWYFLGRDPTGQDGRFRLAVASPGASGEDIAGLVLVPEGSVATSSPSMQTRVVGGVPVGHIVDPRRGPVTSAVAVAVVWAPTGTEADALTKAFVLNGPAAADALAGRVRYEAALVLEPGARAVPNTGSGMRRIGESGGRDVYATPGMGWVSPDPAEASSR